MEHSSTYWHCFWHRLLSKFSKVTVFITQDRIKFGNQVGDCLHVINWKPPFLRELGTMSYNRFIHSSLFKSSAKLRTLFLSGCRGRLDILRGPEFIFDLNIMLLTNHLLDLGIRVHSIAISCLHINRPMVIQFHFHCMHRHIFCTHHLRIALQWMMLPQYVH